MILDAGLPWNKRLCHEFKWGNQTFEDVLQKFGILALLQAKGLTWTSTSEQLWRERRSAAEVVRGTEMREHLSLTMHAAGLDPEETVRVDLPTLHAYAIPTIVQEICEHKLVYEYLNWDLIGVLNANGELVNWRTSGALRFLDSIGQRFSKPWLEGVSVEEWRNRWQRPKDPKRRKRLQTAQDSGSL